MAHAPDALERVGGEHRVGEGDAPVHARVGPDDRRRRADLSRRRGGRRPLDGGRWRRGAGPVRRRSRRDGGPVGVGGRGHRLGDGAPDGGAEHQSCGDAGDGTTARPIEYPRGVATSVTSPGSSTDACGTVASAHPAPRIAWWRQERVRSGDVDLDGRSQIGGGCDLVRFGHGATIPAGGRVRSASRLRGGASPVHAGAVDSDIDGPGERHA